MGNSKKGTKQVQPPTPKAQVAKAFGNKGDLVDAIIKLIGDAPDGTRSALMQVSNSRLLSHHHNTQRMAKQFGTRDGVITSILTIKYPKGAPEGERAKLEVFSPWRLMDAHRQATDGAARAAKVKPKKPAKKAK